MHGKIPKYHAKKTEPIVFDGLTSKAINEVNNAIDQEYIEKCNFEATTVYYEEHPNITSLDDIDKLENGIEINIEPIKKEYVLSQSLIKKIIDKNQEEINYCAKKIYNLNILNLYHDETSLSQLKGIFFETLCIGGGAKGQKVYDLPRKKLSQKKINELKSSGKRIIGDKTIDQIRIENQVERFNLRTDELQIHIVPGYNTQVRITKRWNDKWKISGEFDIFPTPIFYEGKSRLAIIDIKLTMDVNSEFGDFCWGKPQYMDHIQGDMYHYLIRDVDFELNPHLKDVLLDAAQVAIKNNQVVFLYWVFGYKKEPLNEQEKLIERGYFEPDGSNLRQLELKERIRKTISCLERDEDTGWSANPTTENCETCPLRINNKCKSAQNVNKI